MEFILGKPFLSPEPEIGIDESIFSSLKNSKNILREALSFEEAYEVLISTYSDFENEVLSLSANHMIRNRVEYNDFFDIRLRLNIRMVGLLTSARLYIDMVKSKIPKLLGDKTIRKQVEQLFSCEFEENQAYRFMEALRNYVQHRGLPVHGMTIGGGWVKHSDGELLDEHGLEVYSERSVFDEDKRYFNKKVLEELDERIDLLYSTRRYLESLNSVHLKLRKLIDSYVVQSRKAIENAHELYRSSGNDKTFGLCAFRKVDGQKEEEVQLLLDWDDVRKGLVACNGSLVNLSKRYVSSKVRGR